MTDEIPTWATSLRAKLAETFEEEPADWLAAGAEAHRTKAQLCDRLAAAVLPVAFQDWLTGPSDAPIATIATRSWGLAMSMMAARRDLFGPFDETE